MAATNYTPIQLYFSTTASAAPTAANLAQGELAINITDGKLYYEDNAGVVQVIATKGAGTIGGSTTQIQYNNAGALAGSSAMTFNSGTSTTTLSTLNLTNALGAIYGGTAQSTYTQGDILYSSATNTLAKLGIGVVNYILTSSGTVPQWVAPSSIAVLTATNLAGGLAGSVPYQSALDTTTFLAIGAANRVMTSTGTAPQWVTALTGLTGVSSSSITNTGLTSTRLVFSTTGGLETDSANLTFDGTTLSSTGYSTTGLSTLVKTVKIGDSSFNGVAVFAAATPAKLYMGTGTVTDVTSAISATNTTGAIASLAITPIAATNTGVTYTNASTLYIAGAPSAGTNVTITNPYSLYIAAGAAYLGGAVTLNGGTANGVAYLNASKVLTTGSALTFDGSRFFVGTTATTTSSSQSGEVLSTGAVGFLFTNTTAANYPLSVKNQGATGTRALINFYEGASGGTARANIAFDTSTNFALSAAYEITFANGGTEGMRLTSTGLGIGTSSPTNPLTVGGTTRGTVMVKGTNGASPYLALDHTPTSGGRQYNLYSGGVNSGEFNIYDITASANRLTIDASGNLGLGVTPSAWDTLKPLQSANGSFYGYSTTEMGVSQNMYYGSGQYRYISSAVATTYRQISGVHSWYTAPSGTAGNAISFTQAMTLDASGNLFVGGTTGSSRLNLQTTTNSATDSSYITLYNAGENVGYIDWINGNGALARINGTKEGSGASANDGILTFSTAFNASLTEAARIDSSGNLLVSKITSADTTVGFSVVGLAGSQQGCVTSTLAGTTNSNSTFQVYSTGASAYRFYVGMAGTVFATSIVITAISDQRLKENVRDIDTGLDAIMALKPRRFDWKEGKGQDKKNAAGFIAQEFEEVFPECVGTSKASGDGVEYKNINHETLIPTLVKAIQELKAEFDAYKATHP